MQSPPAHQGMVWHRPSGGCLFLTTAPLVQVDRFRQRDAAASESGGILLGRIILEALDVYIDEVTVPSRWDRASRFSFFRSARPAQRAVRRAWEQSAGTHNYLGEWHTHPEPIPRPSSTDLEDWQRIARTASFEQEALFFLIAGTGEIRAWEVARGGGPARPLARANAAQPNP